MVSKIGEQSGAFGGDNRNNKPITHKNEEKPDIGNLLSRKFIPGNSKTKQNGAITPDRMDEYDKDGNLVKTVFGFDVNGDGILGEGDEIQSELIAGNWRTKANGALTPDRMKEYDHNGRLIKTTTGFDVDGDGILGEGDEIQSKFYHNSNNKTDGAIPYDVQKDYNVNGKLETIRHGFDENNNGEFDPGEQKEVYHMKDDN